MHAGNDIEVGLWRRSGLRIGNPRLQDGLVERIAPGAMPAEILNDYEFREEKVRCGICHNRQRHYWGFTVQMSDGSKVLCGNCCIEKLFGSDVWQGLLRSLRGRRREATLRDLVEPMRAIVEACRRAAGLWIGPAKAFVDMIDFLDDEAPDILVALRNRCDREEGRLTDLDGKVFHVVRGCAALAESPHKLLKQAGDLLREAGILVDDERRDLERLAAIRGELRQIMPRAASLMIEAYQFLDRENLRAIARWASGMVKSRDRHSVITDDGEFVYAIETQRMVMPIPTWPMAVAMPDVGKVTDIFTR